MSKGSIFYQQLKLNMILYPNRWKREIKDESFYGTNINYKRKFKVISGRVDGIYIELRLTDSFFDFFAKVDSNTPSKLSRTEFKDLWKHLAIQDEVRAAGFRKEKATEIFEGLNRSNAQGFKK